MATSTGQLVTLNADTYTPIDAGLIPTGEILICRENAPDFRHGHTPGRQMSDSDEQLKLGKGYDHNWVLNRKGQGLGFGGASGRARSDRPRDGDLYGPARDSVLLRQLFERHGKG